MALPIHGGALPSHTPLPRLPTQHASSNRGAIYSALADVIRLDQYGVANPDNPAPASARPRPSTRVAVPRAPCLPQDDAVRAHCCFATVALPPQARQTYAIATTADNYQSPASGVDLRLARRRELQQRYLDKRNAERAQLETVMQQIVDVKRQHQ